MIFMIIIVFMRWWGIYGYVLTFQSVHTWIVNCRGRCFNLWVYLLVILGIDLLVILGIDLLVILWSRGRDNLLGRNSVIWMYYCRLDEFLVGGILAIRVQRKQENQE